MSPTFGPGAQGWNLLPCLDTGALLGTRFHEGTCLIPIDTTWMHGTLVLRGDLVIPTGVRLTMRNVSLLMDPSSDQEWRIHLDGGQLVMIGGTISSNTSFHWRLETSPAPGALVDLTGVNVSKGGAAGGGAYSAFTLVGGNGHRFRHLTVTDSALAPDWHHAVVSTWSSEITDLRIENSTFRNTGRVLQMVVDPRPPSGIVFRDNVVDGFNESGGGGAIYGFNLDILNNTLDTGANQAIWIAHGGGVGGPDGDFHHRVAGNTIAAGGDALFVSGVSGYAITGNTFRGQVFVDGSGNEFAHNEIRDLDATLPIVTFRNNGTVHHNAWRNVTLHGQAALVNWGGYGNVTFFANTFELACAGTNCMAIEVINVREEHGPTFPGFPTVEVAWNDVTWTDLGADTDSVSLDTEFSRRLYVHNNTQRVASAAGSTGEAVTSSILAGGVLDSVFENNTMFGPQVFGIYHFIYEDANDTFQYNDFYDTEYAGIFQAGGSVVRYNRYENAANGWWICPNRPCAGSSTNPRDLAFYGNEVGLASGSTNLTRMSWPDFLNNTFIGHGPGWWNESGTSEPVPGGWLFFANEPIERVTWANHNGGRRVAMHVRGFEYHDTDTTLRAAGSASLSVAGTIDRIGSIDGATVLWTLNPYGDTSVTVSGTGSLELAVRGFRPFERYRVFVWDRAHERWMNTSLSTDSFGQGSVTIVLSSIVDVVVSRRSSGAEPVYPLPPWMGKASPWIRG